MSKITLDRLASNVETVQVTNKNSQTIEDAVDDSISRTGKSPNQMEAELDMNLQNIVNVPTGTEPYHVANKAQVDAVQAAVNSITSITAVAPFYSTTAKEAAASITPTYFQYEPGDVRRYGVLVEGDVPTATTTANTLAFQKALDSNGYVWWQAGVTYMTDTLWVRSGNTLDLNGATLKLVKGVDFQHDILKISPQNIAGTDWQYAGVTKVEHVVVKNGFLNGNGVNNLDPVQGDSHGGGDGGLHGIRIQGQSHHIHLEKLHISECRVDGVAIGIDQHDTGTDEDTRPKYVTLVDVTCHRNTRTGMSITDGDYLEFTRCRFTDTYTPGLATGIQSNTTLGADVVAGATSLTVPASPAHGFANGDKIGYTKNDGRVKWLVVNGTPSSTSINVTGTIEASHVASSGNKVWDGETGKQNAGTWAGVDFENYDSSENVRFTDCHFTGNGGRGFISIPTSANNTEVFISGAYSWDNGTASSGTTPGFHFSHLGDGSQHKNVIITNSILERLVVQGKEDNTVDITVSNCVLGSSTSQAPGFYMRDLNSSSPSIIRLSNCTIQSARDDQYSDPIDIAKTSNVSLIISGGSVINHDPDGDDAHAINLGQSDTGVNNVLQLSGTYVKAHGDGLSIPRGWDAYIGGNTLIESTNSGIKVKNGMNSEYEKVADIDNPSEGAAYSTGDTFRVGNLGIITVGSLLGITQSDAKLHWSKVQSINTTNKTVTIEDDSTQTIADGADCFRILDIATQLTADEPSGEDDLAVDSTAGFRVGDVVEVILTTKDIHTSVVEAVTSATVLKLVTDLPSAAAANRPVYRKRAANVYLDGVSIVGAAVGVETTSVTAVDNLRLTVNGSRFINCTADTANVTGLSQLSNANVSPDALNLYAGKGSIYQSTGNGSIWQNVDGAKDWTVLSIVAADHTH